MSDAFHEDMDVDFFLLFHGVSGTHVAVSAAQRAVANQGLCFAKSVIQPADARQLLNGHFTWGSIAMILPDHGLRLESK
jgi:hypothetical protein